MADGTVAVVLLAAGHSRRFGDRKLFADLRGAPLWRWAAKACEDADFGARYLVIGEDWPKSQASDGWTAVENRQSASGIASSIRKGVEAAGGCDRIVIALADMPRLDSLHLDRLAQGEGLQFTRQADGKPGVPAAFPSSEFDRLLALEGDRGAASLAIPGAQVLDPPDPGMLADVDTPDDLRWLER